MLIFTASIFNVHYTLTITIFFYRFAKFDTIIENDALLNKDTNVFQKALMASLVWAGNESRFKNCI